jgi:hypothetical protein
LPEYFTTKDTNASKDGGGRIASGTAIEYTKAFQFKYLEIFHDELMKLSVINDNTMIFFVFFVFSVVS